MDLPGPATDDARALARSLALSVTVADLLRRRGFGDDEATRRFLEPKLSHLSPPDQMADRTRAAGRIAVALRHHEPITIFGDYDCDGMTSAALLTEVLQAMGGRVSTCLASRYQGGYGFSDQALERVMATAPRLLITCDCGSSDAPRLASARAAGIDVVVIDHHLVPPEPLPVHAFLNPHRPECGFGYKGLASVGLALSLAAAVRAEIGAELDLREWLDLVAIGTVADVAPLVGDNRALVRAGLSYISRARRPGLAALAARANLDLRNGVTSDQIAFRIAPRLNAPGRLGAPDDALQLLIEKSPAKAELLAARIEQAQEQRRALEAEVLAAALAQVESGDYASHPAVIVAGRGWSQGVVGIVAGRLAAQLSKPTIVVGIDEAGVGRGSVRGPKGIRLHDALTACRDVLLKFGGHQAAAGVEVAEARIPELRDRFARACEGVSPPGARAEAFSGRASATADAHALPGAAHAERARSGFERAAAGSNADGGTEIADVRLDPADDPARVVADLARVEPFGEGNPAPRMLLASALVREAREVRGGHLKIELQYGGRAMSAFGPAMASRAGALGGAVHVIGQLRRDFWRGGDSVEVKIDWLAPAV